MGLTSLQVCMDSSDWLQGTIHEAETGIDSSSPSGGDMLTCSRPLIERRLRPQHDQALKCPRCDSTHTKFCYYNNYSLSQPRYFCKTCRRYWTKGGTLRNIPVGGGCRKNKKVSSKKSSNDQTLNQNSAPSSASNNNQTDLHLSFPDMQFPHITNLLGNPSFMESTKYNFLLENNPTPIDFMESKYEAGGNGDLSMISGIGLSEITANHGIMAAASFHGICSPFGTMTLDGISNGTMMDPCQRLMLPYENQADDQNGIDVKPNPKLLSLEWHDQGCSDAGKETFGYINSLGPWTGLMNGYGSSATNPLV